MSVFRLFPPVEMPPENLEERMKELRTYIEREIDRLASIRNKGRNVKVALERLENAMEVLRNVDLRELATEIASRGYPIYVIVALKRRERRAITFYGLRVVDPTRIECGIFRVTNFMLRSVAIDLSKVARAINSLNAIGNPLK
ncbi:MAG: hypothetical protein QXJ48_02310 [Candidatus Korarchaeum sp.]